MHFGAISEIMMGARLSHAGRGPRHAIGLTKHAKVTPLTLSVPYIFRAFRCGVRHSLGLTNSPLMSIARLMDTRCLGSVSWASMLRTGNQSVAKLASDSLPYGRYV
jgi:hypothetical protein